MSASDFNYPTLREGDWLVHDFKFHTGEVLPELKLHYTCVGEPTGEPILVLHGTLGSGAGLLNPNFGGELFVLRATARCNPLFRHIARCDWYGKIQQAI